MSDPTLKLEEDVARDSPRLDGSWEDASYEQPYKDCSPELDQYLAAKLAVMEKVRYIAKQEPKKGSGINYSYASEEALIGVLRPAMVENGITMRPVRHKIEAIRPDFGSKKNQTWVLVSRVFEFRHVSGQYERVLVFGEAADVGDKVIGKAMTHAKKYALRENFLIETGDDPDHIASVRGTEEEMVVRRLTVALHGAKDQASLNKKFELVTKAQEAEEISEHTFEQLKLLYMNILEDLTTGQ